ncbi:MAG: sulfide/dihydroorotate dehydrogenase-like FAD/NAD-binding protein [Desulfomonile tiedjei]|uniref:Sulfide/dihydroorotate dehydrogenase-like FAD/NAD-binding protein n=1 Tax=Desulfomonile tiedjei TaxID=2358 RepID=A0A9D6VAU6_9BACT|nr:sulfide/dihydroorotate dehydrogenase-like FAD/NAD-binding protein [Desulfomonile tiedjei]
MFEILEKERIGPGVNRAVISAPEIARAHKPGQFIILRTHEQGERIPLTVADKDAEKGTITLVWQEVGVTTYFMGTMCVGDRLQDLCGPLGKPTHVDKIGTVVGIGGGIGVAPLFPITKGMHDAGNHVITIVGARTEGLLIMTEDMRKVSDELLIATDDGSFGIHGFVTQVLQSLIDKGTKIDLCVAIGPVPMMRAVVNVTKAAKLPTVVSLNPIMVDGTGMCGACRVEVGGKTMFGCVDGPEFDGHEVDFDLLMKRLAMYKGSELIALNQFRESPRGCQCTFPGGA